MTGISNKYNLKLKLENDLSDSEKLKRITSLLEQIQMEMDKHENILEFDRNKVNLLIKKIQTYKISVALPTNIVDIINQYNEDSGDPFNYMNEQLCNLKDSDEKRKLCFKKLYDLLK